MAARTKVCSNKKCEKGEAKQPISNFAKKKKVCKSCQAAYMREWTRKKKEAAKAEEKPAKNTKVKPENALSFLNDIEQGKPNADIESNDEEYNFTIADISKLAGALGLANNTPLYVKDAYGCEAKISGAKYTYETANGELTKKLSLSLEGVNTKLKHGA